MDYNFTLPYRFQFGSTLTFTLKSQIELTDYYYKSNLDNSRFMSRFPKWSTANQTHFSNTSKLVSPIFETYSSILGHASESLVNNKQLEFGYQSQYFYYIGYPDMPIPSNISTEQGLITYVGEHEAFFIGDFPITKTNLIQYTIPFLNSSLTTLPAILMEPTNIFVRVDGASLENPATIIVYGLDKNGKELSETIDLVSNQWATTSVKYKAVTRVVGEDYELVDHLSLDPGDNEVAYINTYGPQKRITNQNGDYVQPEFIVEDDYIYVNNSNSMARPEIFKFKLARIPDKIFISNLLDIIYLSGTTLYSSKLYLDNISKSAYNSTYNNSGNIFIFIDSETPAVDDIVTIAINIENLASVYGESKFRLRKKIGNTETYIDLTGTEVTENYWNNVSDLGKKVYISHEVEDANDTTFILDVLDGNQEFCCGYYFNTLPEFKLATSISDINYKNHNLVAQSGGNYYTLDWIRPFYTSALDEDGLRLLIFPRDYQELNFNV